MTLDALLEDVFLRGAGTPRAAALAEDRYAQLQAEMPHIPYLSAAETAEMTLLGEKIADRAFQNLPAPIQAFAKAWPDVDEDARVDILHALVSGLNLKHDKALHHRLVHNNPVCQALPAALGAFTDTRNMPNCLGMAQMLIGFARAAGAPHLLMDNLYRYDTYSEYYHYQKLGELLRLIEPYEDDRSFRRLGNMMRTNRQDILKVLAAIENGQQAHHALAIRTNDQWWVVDPYFEVCCPMDRREINLDTSYRHIQASPRGSVTYFMKPARQLQHVEYMLEALTRHLPTLRRLHEPRASWDFNAEGLSCIVESLLAYDLSDKEEHEKYIDDIHATAICAFYPRHRIEQMVKDNIPSDIDTKLHQAVRSKRFRNQSFRRLQLELVRHTFLSILKVTHGGETLPVLQEYLHPTLQLAVKTVNHLGYRKHLEAPELLKYSRSQWIINDTLGMVERSGNKRLQQIAAGYVRSLKKDPTLMSPELRLHLSER